MLQVECKTGRGWHVKAIGEGGWAGGGGGGGGDEPSVHQAAEKMLQPYWQQQQCSLCVELYYALLLHCL